MLEGHRTTGQGKRLGSYLHLEGPCTEPACCGSQQHGTGARVEDQGDRDVLTEQGLEAVCALLGLKIMERDELIIIYICATLRDGFTHPSFFKPPTWFPTLFISNVVVFLQCSQVYCCFVMVLGANLSCVQQRGSDALTVCLLTIHQLLQTRYRFTREPSHWPFSKREGGKCFHSFV